MRMRNFWVQNGPFAPNKHFLGKIINIIFIYLLNNFIVPNFKIFYNTPRVMRMCHFWTQNEPICSNQNISENLLINLIPVIHGYLQHSKNQNWYQSINETLTIKEYWNLIGWEPFLTIITWESDFCQVCSFCRMLTDHKSFRFTTIPDKTKDLIFLKIPKKLLFWPFLTIFDTIFFKKILLSHITKYGTLTPY